MNSKQKKMLLAFGAVVIILAILFVPFETIQVEGPAFASDNSPVMAKYLCKDSSGVIKKPPPFCNYTDSTTDTFKITYSGGKTSNARLNIKKLLSYTLGEYSGTQTFPVKTNVTKTIFYV